MQCKCKWWFSLFSAWGLFIYCFLPYSPLLFHGNRMGIRFKKKALSNKKYNLNRVYVANLSRYIDTKSIAHTPNKLAVNTNNLQSIRCSCPRLSSLILDIVIDLTCMNSRKKKHIILYQCGPNWSREFLIISIKACNAAILLTLKLNRYRPILWNGWKFSDTLHCLAFAPMNLYWITIPIMDSVYIVYICIYVYVWLKAETMVGNHQIGKKKRTDNLIRWKYFMWFFFFFLSFPSLRIVRRWWRVRYILGHRSRSCSLFSQSFIHRTISIV